MSNDVRGGASPAGERKLRLRARKMLTSPIARRLWPGDPDARLLAGYYLWLAGFLLLAGTVLAVLRKQDPAAASLLVPRPDAAAGGLLTAGAVVALLLLLVPLALGLSDLFD